MTDTTNDPTPAWCRAFPPAQTAAALAWGHLVRHWGVRVDLPPAGEPPVIRVYQRWAAESTWLLFRPVDRDTVAIDNCDDECRIGTRAEFHTIAEALAAIVAELDDADTEDDSDMVTADAAD